MIIPYLTSDGWKITYPRVFHILQVVLHTEGSTVKLDGSPQYGNNLPVAAVKAAGPKVFRDGFWLVGPAGEKWLHVVWPIRWVTKYLPPWRGAGHPGLDSAGRFKVQEWTETGGPITHWIRFKVSRGALEKGLVVEGAPRRPVA